MEKRLFCDYLYDYLVKLLFQVPCVQIHALYLVHTAQIFAAYVKATAENFRDFSGPEQ